ncbi:MAG: hypothetical protein AAF492_30410, partial [Verrucomicrobiota bacterium]
RLDVTVAALPATNIFFDTAWFNGTLGGDISAHEVQAYWGPTDGGTNPSAWSNSADLGVFNRTTASNFTLFVSDLGTGTTNYYSFRASNDTASVWPTSSLAVTTEFFAVPGVVNGSGSTTELTGTLITGGMAFAYIFFGQTDGGTNPAAWDQFFEFGLISTGAFSTAISNLNICQTYYFRSYTTNVAGDAWAPSSASFTPTNIGLAIAHESPLYVGDTFVTLSASLDSDERLSDVWLYYGPTDGGTNPAAWDNDVAMGSFTDTVEQVSHTVTGWTPSQPLFFRYRASSCVEEVWADSSESVTLEDNTEELKLTFCGYDRAETLVDFPALILLDNSITGFSYASFSSPDGGDLRFFNEDRNQVLNYEFETWDT